MERQHQALSGFSGTLGSELPSHFLREPPPQMWQSSDAGPQSPLPNTSAHRPGIIPSETLTPKVGTCSVPGTDPASPPEAVTQLSVKRPL